MKTIRNIQKLISTFNSAIEFNMESYHVILKEINHFHNKLNQYSDNQLIDLSKELKNQAANVSVDLIVPAYALVKEVCIRQLNISPYDVQILGAIALHNGKLIEMQTGEGKTLVAVFAAYLNSLRENNVHVLTFNDYLAKRDAKWMFPIYNFLNVSVGFINENLNFEEKRKAYECNVLYAPAKVVGFDFLRSIISYDINNRIAQSFRYAIVDEADAILIDEARNPLVLAGNIIESDIDFYKIASFAASLNYQVDFNTDEYSRNIYLTERGIEKIESEFTISNLHSDTNLELHAAINLALQAKILLKRDVDYILKDGQIKLIDEFTGRIVEDRKWKNGLQTAVEAKENIKINSEGSILNSITLQHLMQKYSKLSGMTATARQAAEEFKYFYNLDTVVIPSNKDCIRIDHPDLIFMTKDEKYLALINEVKRVHETGQPILIGTLTVKESEELSNNFNNHNLKCKILNAKNDELEAEIIAMAGIKNSITISTNMAGRGTDILLGGSNKVEKKLLEKLGGLYVIGTNRHESFRIDRQLRGRAGRQGEIGSSRFFISLEDDLMIKYNLKDSLPKKKKKHHSPILEIEHIQRVIEGQMFDIRRFLYNYSSLIEKQRIIIQNERENTLTNSQLINVYKEAILYQYDKYWALHLDFLSELKEGIHLLRIGGLNPLREFQKKADDAFMQMCDTIDNEIQQLIILFDQNPKTSLSSLRIKKPSSTWTYVINDYPFGNHLGMMLMDNSKIGFQLDILSLIILSFHKILRKQKIEIAP